MIAIGQLVRVMHAITSDHILVGTVVNRLEVRVRGACLSDLCDSAGEGWTLEVSVKVQPAIGPAQWVSEQDCDVVQPSDL